MADKDRSQKRKSVVPLDCAKLAETIAQYGAAVPYGDEPEVEIYGWDEEKDRASTEGQLYEAEAGVRHAVDEAIEMLFAQRTWPQTESLVAWAANRRFDCLAQHLRHWSRLPIPLVMAARVAKDATIAGVCIPLLTEYYCMLRGFGRPLPPPMLFGGPEPGDMPVLS